MRDPSLSEGSSVTKRSVSGWEMQVAAFAFFTDYFTTYLHDFMNFVNILYDLG